MTGRPSKYTKALADEICFQIMSGKSLREVCRSDEMPDRVTVHRWLSKHETFRNQYALAKEIMAEHMFDEMFEIADDGSNDWTERQLANGEVIEVINHEHVQRSKLRIDTRKWALSKMLPKKYGDKGTLELTGEGGGPVKTAHEVSPEFLNMVEQLKAAKRADDAS